MPQVKGFIITWLLIQIGTSMQVDTSIQVGTLV